MSLINYFTKYYFYDVFSSYAQKKNKHFRCILIQIKVRLQDVPKMSTFLLTSPVFFLKKVQGGGKRGQIVVKDEHLSLRFGMCPLEFPVCIVCGHLDQVKVCFPLFLELSQQGRYAYKRC